MAYTEMLTEQLVPVGVISTSAGSTAAAATSTIVDAAKHRRFYCIAQWGAIPSGGTVDFKVFGDSGTSFSSNGTTLTGKSITQVTSTSFSGQIATIEVTAEELKAQSCRYLMAAITIGTTPVPRNVLILADNNRYGPASVNSASTSILRQAVL